MLLQQGTDIPSLIDRLEFAPIIRKAGQIIWVFVSREKIIIEQISDNLKTLKITNETQNEPTGFLLVKPKVALDNFVRCRRLFSDNTGRSTQTEIPIFPWKNTCFIFQLSGKKFLLERGWIQNNCRQSITFSIIYCFYVVPKLKCKKYTILSEVARESYV